MENKNKKEISRRSFLKLAGAGTITTAAALYGCKPDNTVSAEGGSLGEVPTDKMTYRTNHNTGDKVGLLGYGCMRWPLRKNQEGKDEIDQDAVNELVDYAIAHGVNYFDTSPVYIRGWSEKATGTALKRHPRDKYFIATKMSNMNNNRNVRSREGAIAMYRKSLQDLQVDYIDYYLLHTIGNGGMNTFKDRFIDNGVLDFLLKEREEGRIRNLGFSFHGDIAVFDYLLAREDIHLDFAMIQLNYVDWKHATGNNTNAEYLLTELEKKNIPAIIMEPLLGGRLSRVPSQALNIMKEVHPEDSAAKWAFRYAGTPKNVLTVLSGMVYMEHLQENIRAYAPLVPLNEQEYKTLDKVTDILLNADYIQCTECQYCMPCPYGIDIPAVFGHYNRIISAGQRLKSSKDENYKKARQAFLVGYDRSVPKLRQANHCIGCGICKPHCPQRINIPAEMRKIDNYTEQLKQKAEF
ncbi:twin-arginine translocation signal domain-containing protein [Dysgonomonas sp. 216]|uniref:aldo/keto reductase n=1 Tax=Dysgonomonas sp. 216 TaxID=2302934 RepID=UPI0013D42EF6|nr:aldo/keto reductase [Dysgonomonas sp. 216]NDW18825.1 twin-arginine translocation signal domain-containing protein [Dysgonomonas sp. 216]